jgi:hypothetical protein
MSPRQGATPGAEDTGGHTFSARPECTALVDDCICFLPAPLDDTEVGL